MHVLYIHKAFPPQFAPLARALARTIGWTNMFLSRKPDQTLEELTNLQYDAPEEEEKAWDRAFAQQIQHSIGVAEAVRRHRLKPDLVVAHSGFGSVPPNRRVVELSTCSNDASGNTQRGITIGGARRMR